MEGKFVAEILTFGEQRICLFLQASFLVLRVVDRVENMRELTLVGLATHHKKDEDCQDSDSGKEILVGGEGG
jgi:hypothetical protein